MPLGSRTFYATPDMHMGISDILETGRISYGKYSKSFEQEWARLHHCDYGILVSSGTDALRISLEVLKEVHHWRAGDEIIVPALTFVATVNVILQVGLTPILVDVDEYYHLNPALLPRALSSRTRAILPVHLFGQPCDLPAIRKFANDHDLLLLEDACEAAFAAIDHVSIGAWSDLASFSFYMAHIVTTGVGGMILTNNPQYATLARSFANHGLDLDELPQGASYDPSWLARNFTFTRVGYSSRVTEFEAVLGLSQLKDHETLIKRPRLNNFHYLYQGLSPLRNHLQVPVVRKNVSYTPMMFPILLKNETKEGFKDYLRQRGFGVRDALPLTNQPVYDRMFSPIYFPVSYMVNYHGLYLDCHHTTTFNELDEIIQAIYTYFGEEL